LGGRCLAAEAAKLSIKLVKTCQQQRCGGAPAFAAAAKPAQTTSDQTRSRWWEVRDPDDELVCLTVYRKGAREVVRRLAA